MKKKEKPPEKCETCEFFSSLSLSYSLSLSLSPTLFFLEKPSDSTINQTNSSGYFCFFGIIVFSEIAIQGQFINRFMTASKERFTSTTTRREQRLVTLWIKDQ